LRARRFDGEHAARARPHPRALYGSAEGTSEDRVRAASGHRPNARARSSAICVEGRLAGGRRIDDPQGASLESTTMSPEPAAITGRDEVRGCRRDALVVALRLALSAAAPAPKRRPAARRVAPAQSLLQACSIDEARTRVCRICSVMTRITGAQSFDDARCAGRGRSPVQGWVGSLAAISRPLARSDGTRFRRKLHRDHTAVPRGARPEGSR